MTKEDKMERHSTPGVRTGRFFILGISTAVFAAAGCDVAEPVAPGPIMTADGHGDHGHDHGHTHPKTLAEAFGKVSEARDAIRDGFAKNDMDAVDDHLHEYDVPHLLETMVKLAEDAKLGEDDMQSLTSSAESLTTAFDAIHDGMHGGEGSSYDDVAADIDSAMTSLEAVVGKTEAHDHDGHEDGHEDHGDGHDQADHDEHDDDGDHDAEADATSEHGES